MSRKTVARRTWQVVGLLLISLLALSGCGQKTAPAEAPKTAAPTPQNPLRLLAGSELKDIAELAPKIASATGVTLQFEYSGTLDAVEKIASGADVDGVWVSHGKYLQMTPGAKERVKLSEKTMLSPVVLGIKDAKAKSLGWCGNPNVTWQDIASAAEAGKFTFGMTNPASSNSGFTALVGLTAALSGKADALTLADVQANKTRAFFKAQRLTSGSSGWLAEAYLRDQTLVDGIINYESVLLSLNQNPQLNEKLCLIYPKEGIITADYPLMLLNPARQADYEKVVAYLRTPEFQQLMMDKTLRRPVNSTVKTSAAFPSALLIELPFPGQLEIIDALLDGFQNQVRIPAHSWFVLDTSGSMGENGGIEQLKNALAGLGGEDTSVSGRLTRFLNREKIEIITFSERPSPIRRFAMGDNERENTNTRGQIVAFARQLKATGATAIYDSVTAAYQDALAKRPSDGDAYYQTIVLMTDGRNTRGRDFSEFASWYNNLPPGEKIVRVFPVAFGDADMDELKRLAELTGGKAFDGRKGELRQVFKEIRGYQ
ncbi:MAG: hypothetical protein RL497_2423 [Pseudomonadota bacterium]|jgi:Ca-activated chloride channel family protein